jgi:F-type H+-transporting ATPase subunit b
MPQFDTQFLSPLIFWSLVSFGILLFLLYKYGLPAVVQTLEKRERTIREDLEEAERLRKEAQQLLAQYQNQLKAARQEADGIVEVARRESQRLLEENERRIRQETERMVAEARREIDRERLEASREIREETARLVILATERVLEKSLTEADHRRLVDQALEELAERYPGGK